ncbi:hypothetical protein TSUD_175960 [Trifolium subterraneum]|uniref:Albumin I chain a domain-containing protein n=1 Tax=Trifolium subterraneum TaxID=3900 RepID=A0A2Z6LL77_TRISU|nr:hypothetical protein TSUD_175960 [Trifolium subterraneum]
MTYVKFILLSVFLLATFVTFSIKKVDAALCTASCAMITAPCAKGCICNASPISAMGMCIPVAYKDAVKIVGKNLKCQDDVECKNKGTRNSCVRSSPQPDMEYGVCADSISEAQNIMFNIFSKSKFTKDLLGMLT